MESDTKQAPSVVVSSMVVEGLAVEDVCGGER